MSLLIRLTLITLFNLSLINAFGQSIYSASEKFKATLGLVSQNYVDTINADKLVEEAIMAMLEKLDPHSVYISKEELKDMNEPLVGNFEGVGIQFQIYKDTILVVAAISGGPSEKVGIQAGDKIISVDGEDVAGIGIKNSDVVKKLRGNKGTKVVVGIFRNGKTQLMEFTIVRDKIPIYSLDASYMATSDIGYIKLSRFAQTTYEEYLKAFYDLKNQGLKHLILDLRGNGGGYLHIAIALADEFIKDKSAIVYTEGLNSPKKEVFATAKGEFEQGKLVVLIDESSASASEIVSGAVQDLDRGIIIGRRSFGKGLVQNQYPLPDGSAMRLTIARYYTPSGRSIQKPYEDGVDSYHKDLLTRYKNGEYLHQDSIHLPDSLKFYTSSKRVVYGGGGVMPDIFIPLDTSMNSPLYSSLIRKNVFNQYVINYLELHRSELIASYPTWELYKKKFEVDSVLIADFMAFAVKEGVDENLEDLKISRQLIGLQLKALIARNFWQTTAYFEIINELNDAYAEAIRVIEGKMFEKLKLDYNNPTKK